MTTALYHLQRDFLAGIYHDDGAFLETIHTHARVTPARQFTIYRHSIVNKLQKALQAIYPVCNKLVGPDFFRQLTSNYIAQTPSRTPDLNAYGDSLPAFITTYAPADSLPYLTDVARLEWAWHHLYGAPDTDAFDFQKLAAHAETAGENIVLSLPPRTTLFTSPYPVHHIFEMNQSDDQNETLMLLPDQQYHLCVWQQHHVFRIEAVTPIAWQLLSWMRQGYTLGGLCEEALIVYPDVNITALLPDFIHKGWIADVTALADSL